MQSDRYLSVSQSRRVDELAIGKYGISSLVLMENAARGAADVIEMLQPHRGLIWIVSGKGNNGGDGLALARHLEERGYSVRIDLLAGPDDLSTDAKANYEILRRANFPVRFLKESSLLQKSANDWRDATLLIDAILGTGSSGTIREPYTTAIQLMNKSAVPIIAIDVPSGLNAQTGTANDPCIKATATLTFVTKKSGYHTDEAQQYLGDVHVIGLGLPVILLKEIDEETSPDSDFDAALRPVNN